MIDKLGEECSKNIDGNEIIHNVTLNDHKKLCDFCRI